jgi:hypothetical protein
LSCSIGCPAIFTPTDIVGHFFFGKTFSRPPILSRFDLTLRIADSGGGAGNPHSVLLPGQVVQKAQK